MPEINKKRKVKASWELIGRCVVSLISVFLTQFALYMVPHLFPLSSLLTLLSLSVLVLMAVVGFGRCCKKLVGVRASAPAFVFFNILSIWCVHIAVVRQAISPLLDIVFNMELLMLVTGLCCILSSDPGFIMHQSSSLEKHEVEAHSEELELLSCGMPQDFPVEGSSVLVQRARYCRQCKAYVKGFDHHCPAFGNCIGQGNHALFIFLLVGFIISECSYITCSSQFSTKSHILGKAEWEASLSGNLAISTMLFSCLQVVWQVAFLVWHVYCICFNIKTDEWINWRRYPEFQLIVPPQPGQPVPEIRFTNPYNKGILWNLKEFLTAKR
ncbi:unnamed protein product [Ilex paraguariensis]|uniref:S-acyltransferase n=1 Tax=Ilex paraguariensis TaxID=185542 RepID=A0ABC8U6T6_9AQUA